MNVIAYRTNSGLYPITLVELRGMVPVLFGDEPSESLLQLADVVPVYESPVPQYDPATQAVAELPPALVDGVWQQVWKVVDQPRVAPHSVTAAQAKIALKRAGLLSTVRTAVDADPDSEVAIWYSNATNWERNNSHLNEMAEQFSLSQQQVDDLFVVAASIG